MLLLLISLLLCILNSFLMILTLFILSWVNYSFISIWRIHLSIRIPPIFYWKTTKKACYRISKLTNIIHCLISLLPFFNIYGKFHFTFIYNRIILLIFRIQKLPFSICTFRIFLYLSNICQRLIRRSQFRLLDFKYSFPFIFILIGLLHLNPHFAK